MSSNHSLSDVTSLKNTDPEEGFYLDRKAVKLLHEIELVRYKLHNVNHRLEINRRDYERCPPDEGPRLSNGLWNYICRRWNERHDVEKRRERKIEQARLVFLCWTIFSQEKEVRQQEKRLAKLSSEFEARVKWKTKEDREIYRRWVTEEDARHAVRREIREVGKKNG
ncbi:hypothetical protein FBEOM_4189 [Fusarium beomiforme]|uniref:Uncharacterized protein n=1 Tax=Fusarium beomiforme TaxID=44412 RepID=A0A9P5ANP3_9HYPO|nr:hypothetical protein FBEOM_4189 [Fusarium beomiforme]